MGACEPWWASVALKAKLKASSEACKAGDDRVITPEYRGSGRRSAFQFNFGMSKALIPIPDLVILCWQKASADVEATYLEYWYRMQLQFGAS